MFTDNFENNRKLLKVLTKEQLVHFCVHVAKSVLHVWEEQYPDDDRPRKAIEAAEHWLIDQNADFAYAGWAYAGWAYAGWAAAVNAAYAARAAAYADRAATYYAANVIYHANNAGKSLNWLHSLYQAIYKPHPFPNHYKTSNTINIAKAILKDNDFKSMPILADALEDENCTDTELLSHLRCNKDLWCPGDWVLTNLVK